jgi:hypothetical protein
VDILEEVKYPHLDRLELLQPGPQILLGQSIFWTLKEDGSNIGIALVDGVPEIRSRNQSRASKDFYTALMTCPQWEGIVDLLQSANQWHDEYVLFGELCTKGKSPTRIKVHEDTHFVSFDLWSKRLGCFVNYTRLYQECHHAMIPCVELLGTCIVSSLESLNSFEDEMLRICKDRNEEGVVGKVYVETPFNTGENSGTGRGIIYFKSKNDTPKLTALPRLIERDRIQLPPLPESEIFGAIEKVRIDLGEEGFRDIRTAMPMIAQYVNAEGKHHCCATPKNLHHYYLTRLKDLEDQNPPTFDQKRAPPVEEYS